MARYVVRAIIQCETSQTRRATADASATNEANGSDKAGETGEVRSLDW